MKGFDAKQKEYEVILEKLVGAKLAEAEGELPAELDGELPVGEERMPDATQVELAEYESEEVLKAQAKIIEEVKSLNDKKIVLLKDKENKAGTINLDDKRTAGCWLCLWECFLFNLDTLTASCWAINCFCTSS